MFGSVVKGECDELADLPVYMPHLDLALCLTQDRNF